MKNKINLFFLSLLVILLPTTVFAGSTAQERVYVGPEDVIEGNFYAAGESVHIEGRVNGDLIVAGGIVSVSGPVSGDIIAAGGQIRILGPVQGDIRIAGGSVYLDSVVGKNATVFAGQAYFDQSSVIGSSLALFAGDAQLYGSVREDVLAKTGAIKLAGKINGNADIKVMEPGMFFVQSQSMIGGDLNYQSPTRAEVLSGAVISGQVNYSPVKRQTIDPGVVAAFLGIGYGVLILYSLLSVLLVGAALLFFVPKHVEQVKKVLIKEFWSAFGRGLILLFLAVIAVMLLMVSVIGIPLAMAVLAVFYVASLCGIIYFSTWLGESILKKILRRKWRGVSLWWSMLLGVMVFVLLAAIPLVGWLLKLLMIAAGLGAWAAVAGKELKRMR